MTMGENIQFWRKKAGYTQKELADICGVATGTIQQYELDKRQPRLERLGKIAEALDLHLLDLIDDKTCMDLYRIYDKAAFSYYKSIGYDLCYDDDCKHLIIYHNGYGYKVPENLFLKIEDDLRTDAEKNIDDIIAKYKNTKFDSESKEQTND